MSFLPQRKKSAEEITQLRETLGVPALQENHETAPVPAAVASQKPEPSPPPPIQLGPKPVHSLKRSERTPVDTDQTEEKPSPPSNAAPVLAKPVRSLRKSEQIPILLHTPADPSSDSKLPFHRHSDEEIAAIRRREALAMMTPPPPNRKLAVAHPGILILGYLCTLAEASYFFFAHFPIIATAACALAALLIAAFILWRYPISRHHAAFIAVIALIVLAFAILHYFPHLRHAT